MKQSKNYHTKNISKICSVFYLIVFILSTFSCTEEIDFKTETFESALVVQASLTNVNSIQKIVLSRTFAFEEDGPPPESGATVTIIDDSGINYPFQESDIAGTYLSNVAFGGIVGKQYTLNITTANGRNYQSASVTIKGGTVIDRIYAERTTNGQNEDGVSIFLDSYDATNNSKYYRFEYEETYKIVSQFSSTRTFNVDENNLISLIEKTEEEEVCYNTVASNNISLANTSAFGEDRLTRVPVRFLDAGNPKIGKRYSILVKQYVISREAYTFFETLKNFSGSESLFSQVQPGFITGNITSTENKNEKVIGFFEAASVSEKRLFFNFYDIFLDGTEPQNFAAGCVATRPGVPSIPRDIRNNVIRFFFLAGPDDPPRPGEGPYYVMPRPCIDCRAFGSNVVPDFWEE